MNSYIHIKIDGNKSYLVYQRGMIFEMAAIDKYTGNGYDYSGLKGAWYAASDTDTDNEDNRKYAKQAMIEWVKKNVKG